MKPQKSGDNIGFYSWFPKKRLKKIYFLAVFTFVCLCLILLFSCTSAPVDLRTLAPADSLVYLESNDLAEMLNALTENETFKQLSAEKHDFSALQNVQMAITITGFETAEKQVGDEQAILSFKPQFVVIAETHAWSWQTESLVENYLNNFIREIYGERTNFEKYANNEGTWFIWTAESGRQSFAFVSGSLVYFGNNKAAIEKSLAVKRGEAESLIVNESLGRARAEHKNNLAFGFVSEQGVAQIADLIGVSMAVKASEEVAARNLIVKILPEMLKKSVREIVWSAKKHEGKIEDVLQIQVRQEIAKVLQETLVPVQENQIGSAEFLPVDVFSVTRYNLKNPQIAWRSLVLLAANQVDDTSAKILIAFSDTFFAPYGITDGEMFLSAIGSEILTARFDAEGEKSAAIVTVKDAEQIKKSLSAEINFNKAAEKFGAAEIWMSEDKTATAAFFENKLILGDAEAVALALQAARNSENFRKNVDFPKLQQSSAVAVTYSKDFDSAKNIVKFLGKLKEENRKAVSSYITETRFAGHKVERSTISDFGMIGTILEQFAAEK